MSPDGPRRAEVVAGPLRAVTARRAAMQGWGGWSCTTARRARASQLFSLPTRLALLGCTRIGSPSIFGERNPKALFKVARPHVGVER